VFSSLARFRNAMLRADTWQSAEIAYAHAIMRINCLCPE
jgi:hypothetical protein